MCSGLLLCSSGVGGASEVFSHGETGLGFESDNPQSLANALRYVLSNINVLTQIPIASQSHISRNFSVKTSVASIENFFLSFHK